MRTPADSPASCPASAPLNRLRRGKRCRPSSVFLAVVMPPGKLDETTSRLMRPICIMRHIEASRSRLDYAVRPKLRRAPPSWQFSSRSTLECSESPFIHRHTNNPTMASEIRHRQTAEAAPAEPSTASPTMSTSSEAQPSPARQFRSRLWRTLFMLLLAVSAYFSYQQGWLGGKEKPKIIYASR